MTLTDAAGDATQYDYDGNGELIRTVDPLGNVSLATYDANFNLTSTTGPTGLTTSYTYSNDGDLTSVTNALGQTTTYTYGGSDNLITSATNPQADTTSYNYDGERRPDVRARARRHVREHDVRRAGGSALPHRPERPGHELHLQRRRARSAGSRSPAARR